MIASVELRWNMTHETGNPNTSGRPMCALLHRGALVQQAWLSLQDYPTYAIAVAAASRSQHDDWHECIHRSLLLRSLGWGPRWRRRRAASSRPSTRTRCCASCRTGVFPPSCLGLQRGRSLCRAAGDGNH